MTGRSIDDSSIANSCMRRIGFAIARRLGRDGCRVVVSSRKEDKVAAAVAELEGEGIDVLGMACHVGKAEDRDELIKAAVGKFGGIDILVSNAATNPCFGSILDVRRSLELQLQLAATKEEKLFMVVPYIIAALRSTIYRETGAIMQD